MSKYIPFLIITLLIIALGYTNLDIKFKSPESTKIDSIEVVHVIPEKKGEFKTINPAPTPNITNNYISNDKALRKIISEIELKNKKQADSATILLALLEATKTRKYIEKLDDSILTATIKAETQGKLKSIDFQYTLKEQKLVSYDKTTTHKITPKYSLLLGARLGTSTSLENPSIELNAGFQDKNGNMYEFGYNTNQQISVGGKFNIFRKY